MADPTSSVPRSAWAPLRVRAFRVLFTAQSFAMVGTWMQTVGAQWQLVDEPDAAILVGLVQAAAMLPTLLLSLPAGALADIVDRRRLLLGVQVVQVVVAGGLTALALVDRLPPAVLLTAMFLLGVGVTLTIPAYQSLLQDLVAREHLRSVSALNGTAMNLARAIGPAVAGIIISQVGVPAVFAVNTLLLAALAAVLALLELPRHEDRQLPENFGGAVLAGARYVRHSPVVRRLLIRTLLFVVPGAALWALLPLVASELLGLGALGYGWLMAALGVGAVAGAALLPRVVARMSTTRLVLAAGVSFGLASAACAVAPTVIVTVLALVPAGLAWLCMLATMNGILQVFLPSWVRARGLSIYLMVFVGGQALASLLWGMLAQWFGVAPVLVGAGVLLVLGASTVLRWPLRDVGELDRNPAIYWPEPQIELDAGLDDGPVLVTMTYTVPASNVARFLEAMGMVRRMKMRTGATSVAIYRDGADPRRFVEVAQYPSWAEHLRQHGGRLTGTDRDIEALATACTDRPPEVQHLLPPGIAPSADPG
jgi:MFS family permease